MGQIIDLCEPVMEQITTTHTSLDNPTGLMAVDTPGLVKKEIVTDNENEHTVATEYWLHGERVHRSVNMKLKKWPEGMEGFGAAFS